MSSHLHGTPTRASLRKLLDALYSTDLALVTFCIEAFPALSRRFSTGMERQQKQNMLLEAVPPAEVLAAISEARPDATAAVEATIRFETPQAVQDESPKMRELSEQLERLAQQRHALFEQGTTVAALDDEMRRLRRQQRDLAQQPQLQPGEVLGHGRFRLLERCGTGGFGVVWRAWDTVMRARVAIKILHPHLASDVTRVGRFDRGARQMYESHHRHIVRVVEGLRTEDGFHYYVMEYVPGGTLLDAVLNKTVDRQQALRMLLDVGEALSYAHKRGMIHRDVTPQNILLDVSGEALLTDFDLAWVAATTGGTSGALGTVLYAAPEVIDAAEPGIETDVYSLAMTTAFVLYGARLPSSILGERAAFLRQLACGEPLRRVLLQATQTQPQQRQPSIDAFCRALAVAWEQSLPAAPTTLAPPALPPGSLLKPEEQECLNRYSRAFAARYGLWTVDDALPDRAGDLGWAKQVPLKEIYLCLKTAVHQPGDGFGDAFSMLHWQGGSHLFESTELAPDPLHRVLLGFSGSGKTTYIRRLALELLEQRAGIPLVIEARGLARTVKETGLTGDALIVRQLESQFGEPAGSASDVRELLALLSAPAAPTPILFVDGWEDLGPLADRVQRALYPFLSRFPRVRLYLTAQPCARSLPSGKGFVQRRLLSPVWQDVRDFAGRLAAIAAQPDPAIAAGAGYWAGLLVDAQLCSYLDHEIVGTPLFLAQALLSDASFPFPEQRHHLYRQYLEALYKRAERKAAEGALLIDTLYRPPHLGAYLAQLTHLALLTATDPEQPGKSMPERANIAPEMLFDQLTEEQSEGLWLWLSGGLGIAYRSSDQSFFFRVAILAAYLDAFRILSYGLPLDLESVVRKLSVPSHAPRAQSLALLALLLPVEQRHQLLRAMQQSVVKREPALNVKYGLLLQLGSLLADGHGDAAALDLLVEQGWRLCQQGYGWPLHVHWRLTRDTTRPAALTERLCLLSASGDGREWAATVDTYERLQLPGILSPPRQETPGRALVDAVLLPLQTPTQVALGRVLTGGGLPWPSSEHRLILLSLWPSLRRLVSEQCQLLVLLGCSPDDLRAHAERLLRRPRWDHTRAELLRSAVFENSQHKPELYVDQDLETTINWLSFQTRDSIRGLQHQRNHGWNSKILDRLWCKWPLREIAGADAARLDGAIDAAALRYAQAVLRKQGGLSSAAAIDVVLDNCHARVGPRVLLAHQPRDSRLHAIPEVSLLSHACRLSLHPESDRTEYEQKLAAAEEALWPIWIDLARYLAGHPGEDTRARLLEPLRAYPELHVEPLVQWGARFFLGGDIWLPDGTNFSVDALCDAANQPRLPFIDELPEPQTALSGQ